MYIGKNRQNLHRTISALQTQSESARVREPVKRPPLNLGAPPKTCQWLEGEPRDRNFCDQPVGLRANGLPSPYCPEHHARVYVRLTESPE